MNHLKLASLYVGRELTIEEINFSNDEDGNAFIQYWNIADKLQPTIAQLEALSNQLDFNESIQYQHDSFTEYQSIINTQVQTLTNLMEANSRTNSQSEVIRIQTLINSLQDGLLTEQQNVILRINQITNEYIGTQI